MNKSIFLSIFIIFYLLTCFVIPTYRVWKKTGINPVVFGKTDNVYDYIGRAMKILMALIFIVVGVYLVWPSAYTYFGPIEYLDNEAISLGGILLLLTSTVWTIIAQTQMHNSWRIGIDKENKTELVAKGLFTVSRNPIFLGMIVSLLGFFLVLPNAITLLSFVCGYLLIQIQVRLEEDFLKGTHGQAYEDYKTRVRRWV